MTRFLIVRHGESTWNAEGRLQGQLDPPLSEEGRRQSEALAPYVRALRPTHCVSSDLVRARETAAILGWPEPRLDQSWREIDIGSWAGRLVTEVDRELLADWRCGLEDPPGGESRADFLARVGDAVDRLGPADGRTVLVCTHGGCVRMACAHITGADPNAFGPIPNASLSLITVTRRPRLTVLSWIADPIARGPATDLASV